MADIQPKSNEFFETLNSRARHSLFPAHKIGLLLYASDRAVAFKLIFVQAVFGAELPQGIPVPNQPETPFALVALVHAGFLVRARRRQ
jgi:hypothetical protein